MVFINSLLFHLDFRIYKSEFFIFFILQIATLSHINNATEPS